LALLSEMTFIKESISSSFNGPERFEYQIKKIE